MLIIRDLRGVTFSMSAATHIRSYTLLGNTIRGTRRKYTWGLFVTH